MEGLTGWRWRQVQHEMFGGAALYVTPFVSPNGNFSFQRKELEELDPERNRGIPVVPQILTNRAEYFVWAAKECRSRGWAQVDLNLGCPSGTVTGKNKGAGLLRQPELLRQLLDGFFEAGFTLFLVRPLAALRPHYLLTPPGLRQPAPGTPDEDAVRRVHIPLADTLAVSRLLEQGFCGIALYEGADGQPALRLERPNPA